MRRRGRPPKVDHRRQVDAFGSPAPPELEGELGLPDPSKPVTHPEELPSASTALLASLLQLTDSACRKLVAAGMPRFRRNTFRLEDVIPWYLEHRTREPTADAETAREAYYRSQARRVELDIRARLDQVVELGEVEGTLVELLNALTGAAETVPGRYRNPEKRALAQEVCDEVRTVLAESLATLVARRTRGGPDVAPAAAPNTRRVGRRSPTARRDT